MKSWVLNTIKYIFFAFNLLFLISGLSILMAGSAVVHEIKDYSHYISGGDLAMPIIFIITGLSIFFVAFLGCCGAIKENYNMLIGFGIFLMVIFLVELGIGIAAGLSKHDVPGVLRNTMEDAMKTYETNFYDKKAWENLQKKADKWVEGKTGKRPKRMAKYSRRKQDSNWSIADASSGQVDKSSIDDHALSRTRFRKLRILPFGRRLYRHWRTLSNSYTTPSSSRVETCND